MEADCFENVNKNLKIGKVLNNVEKKKCEVYFKNAFMLEQSGNV